MSKKNYHLVLLLSFIGIFLWSGVNPYDMFTWFLEVFPAVIGVFVLLATYPKFRFTSLVYTLIWIHAVILLVGGHYTYAEMPVFNWIRDAYGLDRNYYDRLGHFAQGFIPAMIAREMFVRKSPLKGSKWLPVVVISFCLALSSLYELLEFAVALATGSAAEAFLGTQGDVWDTQWDMLLALCGSIVALLTLSRYHDRLLKKCDEPLPFSEKK